MDTKLRGHFTCERAYTLACGNGEETGAVRICVELKSLNESGLCEVHPMSKVNTTLAQLSRATIFSKLDVNSGKNHYGHQGIQRCRMHILNSVWWLGCQSQLRTSYNPALFDNNSS